MPNLNAQVSESAIAFIDCLVADYQSLIAGVKRACPLGEWESIEKSMRSR
jgi:hypothetical protein